MMSIGLGCRALLRMAGAMKSITRAPRAVACAFIVSAFLSLPAPVARAQVATPDQDAFYAVPSGLDRLPDGAILDSRPIQAMSAGVPMPAQAWQVKFKTTDNLSRATATVTTVMVPDGAWDGPGPRPLVSYQTAQDGVNTK